jgi:hypothetical protein
MQSFFSTFFDDQSIMLTNRIFKKVDKNLGDLESILDIFFVQFSFFKKLSKGPRERTLEIKKSKNPNFGYF